MKCSIQRVPSMLFNIGPFSQGMDSDLCTTQKCVFLRSRIWP